MTDQPEQRRASPESIINLLNERLNQKAQEIRRLEDAEISLAALLNDLTAENAALKEQIASEQ